MAKLKRDQRLCPYCAEAIKVSAIRCRFCQSEIEPIVEPAPTLGAAPQPESVIEAGPKVKADPTVEVDPARESVPDSAEPPEETAKSADGRPPFYRNLTVVLAMLVALAGAGVGALWWQADQGSSSTAPDGTLVSDEARNEVLVTAADLAQRTLSYDYRTLANDKEVAVARMTPSFRKEYESTMAQLGDNTSKNEIVLQAVAVSSAIISATEQKAEVLVFLNQTTTAGTGKDQNQQASRNSLVISLERVDGDWDIADLTALG